MKHLSTLLLGCLLATSHLHADEPFRNHRYDALNMLPVTEKNIVFIGNSITNMHEWWEAFSNPLVLNRGVSGAVSDEMLANLSPILQGKPAKAFLMIGTNDLGTPGIDNAAHVAHNVREALKRFHTESPQTKVYVQSILPSRRRRIALQRETNDSLKSICKEMGVEYVDLWDDLWSVTQDNQHTLDGLHLSASGYKVWCNRIAPLVGSKSAYPEDFTDYASGLDYSNGMRASQFDVLPVADGDVLMIGDELIHGGEWHELFHSPKVKSRSIGWGWPGVGINAIKGCLPAIFQGRPDNGVASKALFYCGTANLYAKQPVEEALRNYAAMLEEAHELSPKTKLLVATLVPTVSFKDFDEQQVLPFNKGLKELVKKLKYAECVDFYDATIQDGKPKPEYFKEYYLSGKGYQHLAEVLKDLLK